MIFIALIVSLNFYRIIRAMFHEFVIFCQKYYMPGFYVYMRFERKKLLAF